MSKSATAHFVCCHPKQPCAANQTHGSPWHGENYFLFIFHPKDQQNHSNQQARQNRVHIKHNHHCHHGDHSDKADPLLAFDPYSISC